MRAPLGYQHPPDRCAAIHAGFARTLIHAVADLEKTLAPVRIYVIGDRRAAGCDRLAENLPQRLVQAERAIPPQPGRIRQRVNSGAE